MRPPAPCPIPETNGLLIAGTDGPSCSRLAALFADTGYAVTLRTSAAQAVADVLRGAAQVVLIEREIQGCRLGDLVTLLKRCNPAVEIIVISGDAPEPLVRRLRREGIFYHALQTPSLDDPEEIRQAVRCAFASRRPGPSRPQTRGDTSTPKERRMP